MKCVSRRKMVGMGGGRTPGAYAEWTWMREASGRVAMRIFA